HHEAAALVSGTFTELRRGRCPGPLGRWRNVVDVRKFLGVLLLAFVHFACSDVLFFGALGIGMKSFDRPHVLTPSERVWISVESVMLLPIADPLHRVTRSTFASVSAGHSYGVRNSLAVVWFFGPLALNSALWATAVWLAYSRW